MVFNRLWWLGVAFEKEFYAQSYKSEKRKWAGIQAVHTS